jgi:glycosyltransferase involved in cell wall biosynthesis
VNKPLVSVIMLTYNHEAFIAQAIECALRQRTDFPFELVIGEDCSTDGTGRIVRGYAERNPDIIRIITSARNVGAKQNSQRCIAAGRGRYAAFCEGDDFWHSPDKLQTQVRELEGDPAHGWVFSDYDRYYEADQRTEKHVNERHGFRWPSPLGVEQVIGRRGGAIRTCTVMVRKILLRQVIDADPYLHQSERFLMGDTQLFAELAAITKTAYCPESLATYRIHDESATRSTDPVKAARFWHSAADMKLYLCHKYRLPDPVTRRHQEIWCDTALRLALHAGDRSLADAVRSRKRGFTWKEWIRYYGAGNTAVRSLYRATASLRTAWHPSRP